MSRLQEPEVICSCGDLAIEQDNYEDDLCDRCYGEALEYDAQELLADWGRE